MYLVYRDYTDIDDEEVIIQCVVQLVDDMDNTVEIQDLYAIDEAGRDKYEKSDELVCKSAIVGKRFLKEYGFEVCSVGKTVYENFELYTRQELVPSTK